MDLFTQIKMAVSVKEAAEYYGLEVNRGNMVCCPFHADRTPSMKLNEDYFYCFGCGAHGDVIDLVAKLFNLSSYDAAKKLAYDFGIDPDKPPAAAALRKPKYPLVKAFQKETLHCQRVLCDYLDFAERQAEREQAMTMQDWSEHLDRILTMSGEQLLVGNGSVSHKQAIDKATGEYRKYKARTLSEVERDYLDSIKLLEQKTDKK
jgi:hypothetical protein